MIVAELAMLLPLYYASYRELLQMVGHRRLRDLEESLDIRTVEFASHRKLLKNRSTLGIGESLADPVELFGCELHQSL